MRTQLSPKIPVGCCKKFMFPFIEITEELSHTSSSRSWILFHWGKNKRTSNLQKLTPSYFHQQILPPHWQLPGVFLLQIIPLCPPHWQSLPPSWLTLHYRTTILYLSHLHKPTLYLNPCPQLPLSLSSPFGSKFFKEFSSHPISIPSPPIFYSHVYFFKYFFLPFVFWKRA